MSGLPLLGLAVAALLVAVLLGEAAYRYHRNVRQARRRINERLTLLAQGVNRTDAMAQLRRSSLAAAGSGRLIRGLASRLDLAGIRVSPRLFLLGMGVVTAAIAVVYPAAAGLFGRFPTVPTLVLVAIFAGAVGIGLPLVVLGMRASKRLKKFEMQFPIALDIFVRGLRAGHPVSAALDLLTTELGDPIGSEFGLVTDEVMYGLTLKDALENLARRIPTQDMQMFVVCVGIQSETGGNLADILDGLSKVIRERASMVLKVRALASEGKMSGIMLSVLPVGTFCLVFFNSPGFYLDVADDPIFMPALLAILFVYTSGVVVMKKLTNLKV